VPFSENFQCFSISRIRLMCERRKPRSFTWPMQPTLLKVDPIALLYVATVLARRLDNANQALIELRHPVQAGQPRSVIEKTVEKMEGLLGASGASLVYAGYPYDPYA